MPTIKKFSKKHSQKQTKSVKALDPLLITVVDQHHHVLKPMWDAVRQGRLPETKVKLLHFDSHPDMGCIGAEESQDPKNDYHDRVKDIIPRIFNNKFSEKECLELSDIATWIPTLVAQDFVDEVIWVAGHWCKQFDQKTYELVVGKDKRDGFMKIAIAKKGNGVTQGDVNYWAMDSSLEPIEQLEDVRPWKLHVVKFGKNGKLTKEGINKIVKVCKGKPWILDIDEDYLSTQNPFTNHFYHMFGKDAHDDLMQVWDHHAWDTEAYQGALEKVVQQDVFLMPPSRFADNEHIQMALAELVKGGKSTASAKKLLDGFRTMCKMFLPARPAGEVLHARKHEDSDIVVQTAYLESVPHHISTLPEMVKMAQSTRELFKAIRTEPGVVTIATSRADEYTPEAQADCIHDMIIDLTKNAWKNTRKVKVVRRDFRSPLSISDGRPELLALFLSRGRRMDLD